MTGRNAKRNQVNSLNSFLIIQAKLKLILHKEFGLKESSTFFHVLDQILEYPFFSDIKKDIPYLRELYKDMNRDLYLFMDRITLPFGANTGNPELPGLPPEQVRALSTHIGRVNNF